MNRAARIMVAACVSLTAAGAAYAQGVRLQRDTGSGAKVHMGERKGSTSSAEAEKKAMKRGCTRHLDKAEKLMAEGKYGPACRELAAAKALTITRKLGRRWMDIARRLNRIGQEQLSQAGRAYEQRDYSRALAEYKRIAATFAGLPVSAQARDGLRLVRDDPEAQAALKERRAQKLFKHIEAMAAPVPRPTSAPATQPAGTAPAEAAPFKLDARTIAALSDQKLVRVVDSLENLVKVCSGAPTAEKAARLLEQLNADPAAKLRLGRVRRAREAEQTLKMAITYHKAGLLKKAAGLYRQVMKDFPRSPQATKAAAQLGSLEATLAGP